MKKPNILVVIPARKGSKGIKAKNKKLLLGKPLVSYTLEISQALPDNYQAYISTDDDDILEIARKYNVRDNGLRPKKLSGDNALTLDVLSYELNTIEKKLGISFDGVLLLQPTCPIRDINHIFEVESLFTEKKMLSSVVSIKKIDAEHPFRMKRIVGHNRLVNFIDQGFEDMRPRQDLPPVYIRNGSLYLTPSQEIRNKTTLVTNDAYGYVMDEKHSINIDNMEDFLIAEHSLNKA